MRRAVLVWVGSIALGVGCSLLTDLGGLGSPDAATAADGSSSDGPSVGDVQGIDAPQGDASVNLLANPDFEQGTGACGPGWVAPSATFTRSTTAHSGQYSCLVCGTAVDAGFSMFASPQPITNPTPGTSYYAQAWFSMVPDAALNSVALELYEYFDGGGTPVGYKSVSGTTQGWQPAQIPTTIDEAGVSIGFEIHAGVLDGATAPGCFLIDDTEVVKQ